jgi:1-acyl-sn-glycerol-3-phosphate acyltransferase
MMLLRRIWGYWGFIWFGFICGLALVLILPFHLFFPSSYDKYFQWYWYQVLGRCVLYGSGIFVRRHGATYYEDKAYMILANHTTAMDIPIQAIGIPSAIPFKFLAKSGVSKIPVLSSIARRCAILVDRHSAESRQAAKQILIKAIQGGQSVLIYPEGGRNRTTSALAPFKMGSLALAYEHNFPVVVNTVVGAHSLNPVGKYLELRPGIVESHWSEVIEPQRYSSALAFCKAIEEMMLDILEGQGKS